MKCCNCTNSSAENCQLRGWLCTNCPVCLSLSSVVAWRDERRRSMSGDEEATATSVSLNLAHTARTLSEYTSMSLQCVRPNCLFTEQ